MKSYNQFINENVNNTYTMYSGISLDAWKKIWKNKNFKDIETNVTSEQENAFDFSYDFNTGEYNDIIVEISNIPLDSFIAYRNNKYKDDDDFYSMNKMTIQKKQNIIDKKTMFLINLFLYKNQVTTKLIKLNDTY